MYDIKILQFVHRVSKSMKTKYFYIKYKYFRCNSSRAKLDDNF